MKLVDWAKDQKICYMTGYRWFKKGWLNAFQLPNGTIIVKEKENNGYKKEKQKTN